MKKKLVATILSVVMAASLCACGSKPADTPAMETSVAETPVAEASTETVASEIPAGTVAADITLWTYPVGNWGDAATVNGLISDFNAVYPDINVSVEYLDYTNGDDQMNTAIEGGQAPDIVLEGPERLVANWGAKGLMVDLTDLWTDEAKSDVYDSVKSACINKDGQTYEYPLCMTAHCMAINYDLFKEADALQYIDEEKHTWTAEGFQNAVKALVAYGQKNAGAVYCSGQGGDQGTRALINNLYGGTFTNAEHTAYTVDDEKNVKALEMLSGLEGINFDASIAGGDEIKLFCNKTLAMAFCWNVGQEKTNAETVDFDIFPMAFPTESGDPKLCGGIWGFGVFDNGDPAKIEAAKTFINYACNEAPEANAKASTYWSARKSLSDMYAGDDVMTEYGMFMQYMGDYYQVTPGWTEARTAWWNMLQQVGSGADVKTAVTEFSDAANAAASAQ